MKGHLYALLVVSGLLFSACHSESGSTDVVPRDPIIESRTITVSELTEEFDESRTYHYRFANLQDPEHTIIALWHAGIHTTRAWQPMDNPMCMDPQGPTFTVELDVDSPAIVDSGFQRGVGRLFCATTITEFLVSRAGS